MSPGLDKFAAVEAIMLNDIAGDRLFVFSLAALITALVLNAAIY